MSLDLRNRKAWLLSEDSRAYVPFFNICLVQARIDVGIVGLTSSAVSISLQLHVVSRSSPSSASRKIQIPDAPTPQNDQRLPRQVALISNRNKMLATPSGTPESAPPSANRITRGHSCVLCQQRKVKCDKQKPSCGNCIKARAECVPSAPTVPRRRKRKIAETDLVGRLRKYELLLKTHGIKVDDEEPARKTGDGPSQLAEDFDPGVISMLAPRARNSEKGALFAEKENSHYVEKYFLPPL
jgi:hypothetical protein